MTFFNPRVTNVDYFITFLPRPFCFSVVFASCCYCFFLFYQAVRTGCIFTASNANSYSPICRDRRQVYFASVNHQKRNYGVTRSTWPITADERTALFKSQSEVIIEIPGNTRGAGTSFCALIRRRTIPGFCSSAMQAMDTFLFKFQSENQSFPGLIKPIFISLHVGVTCLLLFWL